MNKTEEEFIKYTGITLQILAGLLLLALPKEYFVKKSAWHVATLIPIFICSHLSTYKDMGLYFYMVYHTLFLVLLIYFGKKDSSYLYAIVLSTIAEVLIIIRLILYKIITKEEKPS